MVICFKLIVSGKNIVYTSKLSTCLHICYLRTFSIEGVLNSLSPCHEPLASRTPNTPPLSLNKMCSTHHYSCAPALKHDKKNSKVGNKLSVTTKLSRAPSLPPMGNRDISLSRLCYHFSSTFSTVIK